MAMAEASWLDLYATTASHMYYQRGGSLPLHFKVGFSVGMNLCMCSEFGTSGFIQNGYFLCVFGLGFWVCFGHVGMLVGSMVLGLCVSCIPVQYIYIYVCVCVCV